MPATVALGSGGVTSRGHVNTRDQRVALIVARGQALVKLRDGDTAANCGESPAPERNRAQKPASRSCQPLPSRTSGRLTLLSTSDAVPDLRYRQPTTRARPGPAHPLSGGYCGWAPEREVRIIQEYDQLPVDGVATEDLFGSTILRSLVGTVQVVTGRGRIPRARLQPPQQQGGAARRKGRPLGLSFRPTCSPPARRRCPSTTTEALGAAVRERRLEGIPGRPRPLMIGG